MRLTEDLTKALLAADGVPVPRGAAAGSPEEALETAAAIGDDVMVKALVPANRRGKAGGVLGPLAHNDAAEAARRLLGSSVAGFSAHRVYIEEWLPLTSELYLSFSFSTRGPILTASLHGGIDIEDVVGTPDGPSVVSRPLDPRAGTSLDEAGELWRLAGAELAVRYKLAVLTVAAAGVFADDALVLELNPVGATRDGRITAVGALMELDDAALFRHPDIAWSPDGMTMRKGHVAGADFRLRGPSVRYVEHTACRRSSILAIPGSFCASGSRMLTKSFPNRSGPKVAQCGADRRRAGKMKIYEYVPGTQRGRHSDGPNHHRERCDRDDERRKRRAFRWHDCDRGEPNRRRRRL